MIQIKRGTTNQWEKANPQLAPGQPGFDLDLRKLKIGNTEGANWKDLEYVIGDLDMDRLIQPIDKSDDKTVFTYGSEIPETTTNGLIYLQQYDGSVEVDYVVGLKRDSNYFLRKWESGLAECWGVGDIPEEATKVFKTTFFKNTSKVDSNSYFVLKGYWKTVSNGSEGE